MSDILKIDTRILAYGGLPFESQADIDKWFNPQTEWQKRGGIWCRVVTGPARMSERERARYLIEEGHNVVNSNGRTQIITYIGSNALYTSQFGNILSLGNGVISSVGGGTFEAGEYYRQSVTTQIYTGSSQVDMQTTITGSNGNGTITSIAIWGNGATTSLGTGSQLTHALFSLSKTTGTAIIDYVVSLS